MRVGPMGWLGHMRMRPKAFIDFVQAITKVPSPGPPGLHPGWCRTDMVLSQEVAADYVIRWMNEEFKWETSGHVGPEF